MRGIFLKNKSNRSSGLSLAYPAVLGVRIQKNQPNTAYACVYTDSNSSAVASVTTTAGVNMDNGWFERFRSGGAQNINLGLRPCIFKNGRVVAYLNSTRLDYLSSGGFSPLYDPNVADISDCDIMVEINHCWMSITNDTNYIYVKLASYKVDDTFQDYAFQYNGASYNRIYVGIYPGYLSGSKLWSQKDKTPTNGGSMQAHRAAAKNKGEGYTIMNWYLLNLLKALNILRFKSLASQAGSGAGYGISSDTAPVLPLTGSMYQNPYNVSGTTKVTNSIKTEGCMEDLYGGLEEWCDGITYQSPSGNSELLLATSSYNGTDMYTGVAKDIKYTPVSSYALSGFISGVHGTNEAGFFPNAASGNFLSYYCDTATILAYSPQGSSRAGFSYGLGRSSMSSDGGIFRINAQWASSSSILAGSRLVYRTGYDETAGSGL